MNQNMKDLAAMRTRAMAEQDLDTRMSVQKAQPERVGFTIYVKPAHRKRLDCTYLKLKMDGVSISRPDFCENILQSGLDPCDTMLERLDLELGSAEAGGEAEEALSTILADDRA